MVKIKFGPAGLGGSKIAVENLEKFSGLGLKACEIAFTYSVYIKPDDAKRIGKAAKKLGISLSIHAPYWINLNSDEPEKVKKSRERILNCCKIGELLGAKVVVFHPGYYGSDSPEKTYENIKSQILEIQKELKKSGWKIKLAPEVMGRVNVFGSIEEISKLVKETGCSCCVDFAHILARYKKYRFKEAFDAFKGLKKMHVHFSGIIYGEKGEKKHKKTPEEDLKKLIRALEKYGGQKDITVINESPEPVKDSVRGLEIYRR